MKNINLVNTLSMEKKNKWSGLNKATAFIANLVPSLIELLGNPTISVESDYVDVIFSTYNVIRDLIPLHFPGIEYRMYAEKEKLVFIYTFYNDED